MAAGLGRDLVAVFALSSLCDEKVYIDCRRITTGDGCDKRVREL